jgi:hypothetical protein
MRRHRKLRRQDGETLEQWLRRRTADPANGIPIDPRMTLDLYDKVASLEARVLQLESGQASHVTAEEPQ